MYSIGDIKTISEFAAVIYRDNREDTVAFADYWIRISDYCYLITNDQKAKTELSSAQFVLIPWESYLMMDNAYTDASKGIGIKVNAEHLLEAYKRLAII